MKNQQLDPIYADDAERGEPLSSSRSRKRRAGRSRKNPSSKVRTGLTTLQLPADLREAVERLRRSLEVDSLQQAVRESVMVLSAILNLYEIGAKLYVCDPKDPDSLFREIRLGEKR